MIFNNPTQMKMPLIGMMLNLATYNVKIAAMVITMMRKRFFVMTTA